MSPEDRSLFEALEADELLALLVYGEARGEDWEGKKAVASVVLNRADKPGWWGRTLQGCILHPFQFSCFNDDDPNFPKLRERALNWYYWVAHDAVLRDCWKAADGLIDGAFPRNTRGTHYHEERIHPKWADKLTRVGQIGHHIFYA